MESQTVCAKCGGTGWIVVERPDVSDAKRCDCIAETRSRRLEERAQIPPLYQSASLDNFKLPKDNPIAQRDMAQILLTVKGFVREFPDPRRPGLLLVGDPGTGKTHLAVAAMRMLLERGFECQFFDYQNLLDSIRAGYDPASNSSDKETYKYALETEVLLLDDLGAHRVTDWVEDTVTSIVTYRCNNRKPLIATTNLADADAGSGFIEKSSLLPGKMDYKITLAERIGARARSRLFEMCKVVRMPMVGDYRLRSSSSF